MKLSLTCNLIVACCCRSESSQSSEGDRDTAAATSKTSTNEDNFQTITPEKKQKLDPEAEDIHLKQTGEKCYALYILL